ELVIEQDRLFSLAKSSSMLENEFDLVKRISSNLHYGIMKARMVQMGFLFNKFHRILRDAGASEKKKVELVLEGTDVEIDRNVLKSISDSLIHIVRNSVSHGIESSENRAAAGKSEIAQIKLSARHDKDNVVITISDDGKGIDSSIIRDKIVEKKLVNRSTAGTLSENEVIRYIFEPGFSSADKVTELAGRGVGMDVVKKSVEGIGGQVIVKTEVGRGTDIDLLLPSSLAIKGALLFTSGNGKYAIALSYIKKIHVLPKNDFKIVGNNLTITLEDETLPVIFLREILEMNTQEASSEKKFYKSFDAVSASEVLNLIVVRHSERQLGIVVDGLERQKSIVEKKLMPPLESIKILSGSTILESGKVCFVLDVAFLVQFYKSTVQ
ncbi:MAG: chemotaxis protein CheW, partial [Bacteroidota bacterium]